MADHEAFYTMPRTEATREKMIDWAIMEDNNYHALISEKKGDKVVDHSIRFHALNKASATPTNGAAGATDTLIQKLETSILSFSDSTLFNTTLKNNNDDSAILAGLLVLFDVEKISPDTDKSRLYIDVRSTYKRGNTISRDADTYKMGLIELDAKDIVHAGVGSEIVPYAGPFVIPFLEPPLIKSGSPINTYVNMEFTCFQSDFAAYTVESTITIGVKAYVILVDPTLYAKFPNLLEMWKYLKSPF